MRSSKAEKDPQVDNVEAFRDTHVEEAKPRLKELQKVASERKSTFAALMEVGKVCSLGSMSHALFDVGGEYRRNMSGYPRISALGPSVIPDVQFGEWGKARSTSWLCSGTRTSDNGPHKRRLLKRLRRKLPKTFDAPCPRMIGP